MLFSNVRSIITSVDDTEKRMGSLLALNLAVTNMMIIGDDMSRRDSTPNLARSKWLVNSSYSELSSYFSGNKTLLISSAQALQLAQKELSATTEDWSSSSFSFLESITLSYANVTGLTTTDTYTIWQAIMELVASAMRIADMEAKKVVNTDPTVYFVLQNTFNNISQSIINSANEVVVIISKLVNSNRVRLLVMICGLNGAFAVILVLMGLLMYRIKLGKQNLFLLFMKLRHKEVTDEIAHCKKFASTYFYLNDTEIMEDEEEDEANTLMKLPTKEGKKEHTDGWARDGSSHHNMRHCRSLNLSLGSLIVKMIILSAVAEGYFLLKYFLASKFLDSVSQIYNVYQGVIYEYPSATFAFNVQKYVRLRNRY